MVGFYTKEKFTEQKPIKYNEVVIAPKVELDINEHNNKESLRIKAEKVKLNFEKGSVSLKYANRCGFKVESIENVRKMFTTMFIKQSISDKQELALNELVDGCFDWYDYLAGKDVDFQSQLKENIILKNKLMESFSFGDVDNSSILEARNYIKDKDPDLASAALIHLLKFDSELIDHIYENIGFQDRNYLNNYSIQIAALYSCKLSGDCGLYDSDAAQTSCLINVNTCGLSFYEKMNDLYSQSQIIEMENIIVIISNYFKS